VHANDAKLCSEVSQELIKKVKTQVDYLVLVDNSPEPCNKQDIVSEAIYMHFPENIGIASAHNLALKKMQKQACEFGLLLDQDSQISDDFVFRLSSLMIASKVENNPIVAIGPRVVCSFSASRVRSRVQREIMRYGELVCVKQIISSGMLIDLSKLNEVGMKDDSLFIDGVDHEWCWRAKTKGYMVAIADKLEMVHRQGDARSKFVGVTYKVGSAIRLYYQFRNILILCRRGYVPLYWKLRNITYLPLRALLNATMQDNKRQRVKYMLCGLWDGLCKKSGAFHEHW